MHTRKNPLHLMSDKATQVKTHQLSTRGGCSNTFLVTFHILATEMLVISFAESFFPSLCFRWGGVDKICGQLHWDLLSVCLASSQNHTERMPLRMTFPFVGRLGELIETQCCISKKGKSLVQRQQCAFLPEKWRWLQSGCLKIY